eukprot:1922379-Rhodomonas_salina.1
MSPRVRGMPSATPGESGNKASAYMLSTSAGADIAPAFRQDRNLMRHTRDVMERGRGDFKSVTFKH